MQNNADTTAASNEITLVLGGTGKTGQRVAERLKARGIATRAVSRSTTPAFDWHREDTWPAVLEGVTAVYVNYSPDLAVPGASDLIQRFTDAAVAAGVNRLVLLSGRGEKEAQACERIVQAQPVEWVVVRSSWFMQNFSEGEFAGMVLDGAIGLPAGDTPEPFIDVNDIADVVVAALTEEGHAHETYEVTGPRILTFSEVAAELSRATGRDIAYAEVPQRAFESSLRNAGLSGDILWLLGYLFSTVLDGRNAYVSDGVQRALGREPADFSDFVDRIAARGTWNSSREDVA